MSTQSVVNYDDEQSLKEYGWTKSQLQVVRNLYCKDCTDEEVKVFAYICKHTKLDPFLKQIYAIRRGGKMTVQTAIDGYRLIAERTGRYSPGRETLFVEKDKTIISATSYIKKMTSDGTWHEVAATAYFDEFKADNLWKKMPHVMLAKCAEAQALRKAFPAELSAVYTKEELDQADDQQLSNVPNDAIDVSVEPIKVSGIKKISAEQLYNLEISLRKCTADFCKRVDETILQKFGATTLAEIPEENLNGMFDWINIHLKAQEKKNHEESNV